VRIVVVCDANRARSPVAAALIARHATERGATDVDVDSAGVHARDDEPAVTLVADVARERTGVDLARHRSRALTDADLTADLVITMTRTQLDRITPRAPGLAARVFTLRELVALLALPASEDDEDEAADDGTHDARVALIERAHGRRHRRPLAEDAGARDDIEDPVGPSDTAARLAASTRRAEVAVATIDEEVARLADLLFGPAPG
jgi:protein-tyrosine phosphatase